MTFTCSLIDAEDRVVGRVSGTAEGISDPIPLTAMPGTSLSARLNYSGSQSPDIVVPLDLSAKGGFGILDGAHIRFTWLGADAVRPLAADDPSPVSYMTGFDERGAYYFLSYIPWIKSHFVVAEPAVQNSSVYMSPSCSCQFNEGVLGRTYIDTNDLPVPAGTTTVTIAYVYQALAAVPIGPSGNLLRLNVFEDGSVKGTYYSNYKGQHVDDWFKAVINHELSAGTTYVSVELTLLSQATLGGVVAVDCLTIDFIAPPVDNSIPILVYADSKANIAGINRVTGSRIWNFAGNSFFEADGLLSLNNVIYFGDGSSQSRVYALNAATGALIWQSAALSGQLGAAPVASQNNVLVGTSSGIFYALNKATGTINWQIHFASRADKPEANPEADKPENVYDGVNGITPDGHFMNYLATDAGVVAVNDKLEQSFWFYPTSYGVQFSVILTETMVIFSDRGGNVAGLNKSNGTRVWSRAWPSPVNSQFYLIGGVFVMGDDGGNLSGLKAEDGSTVWTLSFPSGSMIRSFSFDGTFLYVSTNQVQGRCYCYSFLISADQRWNFTKVWDRPMPIGAQCPPVLDNTTIYFTSANQELYAFAKYTGTPLWTYSSGAIAYATPAIEYASPMPELSRLYSQSCFLVAHNAYANIDDGWYFAQQTHSIPEQLNMGARGLELDIYLKTINGVEQVVYDHDGLGDWFKYTSSPYKLLSDSLGEIKSWMDNNPNEVVTIIFEQGPGLGNPSPILTQAFVTAGISSYVFYANRTDQGGGVSWNVATQGWPTLQWMVNNGKRLVVFSQKNKGNATGFAYLWDYSVENQYGLASLCAWCGNREESEPLNQNAKKLFVVNYALNIPTIPSAILPMSSYSTTNNYYMLMMKLWWCQNTSGNNRLPNLLKVNFFDCGTNGGPLEVVKQVNLQLKP